MTASPTTGGNRSPKGQSSRTKRRSRLSRTRRRQWAIAWSAALAPLAGASPVGMQPLDTLWASGLAALGAFLGVRCKRGPLLVAALLTVATSRTYGALAFATASVVLSTLSARHLERRAPFARGMAGGTAVLSLLATSEHAGLVALVGGTVLVAVALVGSGFRHAHSYERRWMWRGALVIGGLCGAASAAAGYGIADNATWVDAGTGELRAGLAEARAGDAEAASLHLERAEAALEKARDGVGRWGTAARLVPAVAQNVEALTSVLESVERVTSLGAEAASVAVDEALEVRAGTVDLEAIRNLRVPLERLAVGLAEVIDEVDSHADDPLVPPLVDRLNILRFESVRAARDAQIGAAAAATMPTVLGGEGERRYLVLFTSPAEARGRFGFPASFAEVTFLDGRFRLGEHGNTSRAFQGRTYDQAAFDRDDPLLRPYEVYGATRQILSATIPPDFPTVAEAAAEMWAQSGRPPVDGVLRFDPASLAPLLALTGPVPVEGLDGPLTAENVEEFLLIGQYQRFPDPDPDERREVLETVADTTFQRLETADLPAPRVLADVFGPPVSAGHLNAALFDPGEHGFMQLIGLDGAFAPPEVDGVMVSTINGLGNKIDSFLTKRVTYEGRVRGGELDARLRVELRNGAPGEGLPDYVIGSFAQPAPARGTNRTTVLLYTGAEAEEVLVGGQPAPFETEQTGGWWLHRVVVEIPPGGSVDVEAVLAGTLPKGSYALRVEPGGGTTPDDVEVDLRIDGREVTYRGRPGTPAIIN